MESLSIHSFLFLTIMVYFLFLKDINRVDVDKLCRISSNYSLCRGHLQEARRASPTKGIIDVGRSRGIRMGKILTQRNINSLKYQFLFIICLLQLHKGVYITKGLTNIRKPK